MRRHPLAAEPLSLAAVFLAVTLCAPFLRAETFAGLVTHVTTQHDFEVDGRHVTTTTDTVVSYSRGTAASQSPIDLAIRLGQTAEVSGKLNAKTHSVQATKVHLVLVPAGAMVSGVGVIDLIPPPDTSAPPNTLIVRRRRQSHHHHSGHRPHLDASGSIPQRHPHQHLDHLPRRTQPRRHRPYGQGHDQAQHRRP